MLIEKNLILTRAEPNGNGGVQFLYKVANYGVSAISRPQEEISQINWELEVLKFSDGETIKYEICHNTDLADKTLVFYNDKSANEFLEKAFGYFEELGSLESMMDK